MQFEKDEIDIVIYHNPCNDGFGSAYVVWRYYMENNNKREIKFYPASYGKVAPPVQGKNVLICDYSYPLKIMEKMVEEANSLLIIDHHSTSEKNLEGLDENNKIFDMSHSGAILTWKYFYPDQEIPAMLLYIEDRDIWTKKLKNNEEFSAWFFTVPMEFEKYHEICTSDNLLEEGIEKGKSYLELDKIRTKNISKYAVPKFIRLKNREKEEYFLVAHINSNTLMSDVGNHIFNIFPFLDFSAIYTIKDNINATTFSLRSTNHHTDVSKISGDYLGGGGHRNASGAIINGLVNCLSSDMKDNYTSYNILTEGIYSDKVGEFNIVYLNSSHHKTSLGKYLLQTRNLINHSIQNANYIGALQKSIKNEFKINWQNNSPFLSDFKNNMDESTNYHMSSIWSFESGITKHRIIFSNHIDIDEITKFCKEYFDIEIQGEEMEINKSITIYIKGLEGTIRKGMELAQR